MYYIIFLLFFTFNIAQAKNCKKGKPCGNTCIARSKTCHIDRLSVYAEEDFFKDYLPDGKKGGEKVSLKWLKTIKCGETLESIRSRLGEPNQLLVYENENGYVSEHDLQYGTNWVIIEHNGATGIMPHGAYTKYNLSAYKSSLFFEDRIKDRVTLLCP